MRFPQAIAARGSQKWIQRAVNNSPVLNGRIIDRLQGQAEINWRSPLEEDQFAEYRDECFLERVGLAHLSTELREFWPRRGPQWDALAQFGANGVLLVEAKAHVGELWSPSCKAKSPSLEIIEEALNETAEYLTARPRASWTECFYQLANRVAHLHFLRSREVNAKLVLINFVGDGDVEGPGTEAEWRGAYQVVWDVLGQRAGRDGGDAALGDRDAEQINSAR